MRLFLLLFLLYFFTPSFSQVTCGTDRQHNYLMQHSTEYARTMARRETMRLPTQLKPERPGHPDTIQVVVHVLHTGEPVGSVENPAEADIQKMIDGLNLYFKAGYPDDAGLNRSVGVDIGLYFTLAKLSPSCLPTNGINRVYLGNNVTYKGYGVSVEGYDGITQESLAGYSYWNNTRYLNVWLVNKISNGVFLGYAYYPTGQLSIYDGVILENSTLQKPAILAHEVGHAFSLYHTFYGSNKDNCTINRNCDLDGDQVCDTDPVLQVTDGCYVDANNPCTNQPFGNMVYNHMSYSCGTIFTTGQKSRMRMALEMYRNGWLTGSANNTGCSFQPLQLLAANTEKKSCNVMQLKWKATAEQDTRGYEIEASEDGISFMQLGALRATGGYGDTSTYMYSYSAIRNGQFFLRLKQVAWDGSSQYFNLPQTEVNCVRKPYTVYPNPTSEWITLATGGSENNTIIIFNASGQVVDKWSNTPLKRFDVRHYPPGVYIVRINTATNLRFIKH